MLTEQMKSAAELYALGSIAIEDVCFVCKVSKEEIPTEFYAYAEEYGKGYDEYLKQKQSEEADDFPDKSGGDPTMCCVEGGHKCYHPEVRCCWCVLQG